MNHNGLLLLPTENQVMSHNAMIEGDQCTQLRSQQLDCFLSQLENTKQTPLSEHCVGAFAMSLHGSANLRHLSPTGVAISQSQHAAHAHTHMTEYDFSGLQPISLSPLPRLGILGWRRHSHVPIPRFHFGPPKSFATSLRSHVSSLKTVRWMPTGQPVP